MNQDLYKIAELVEATGSVVLALAALVASVLVPVGLVKAAKSLGAAIAANRRGGHGTR